MKLSTYKRPFLVLAVISIAFFAVTKNIQEYKKNRVRDQNFARLLDTSKWITCRNEETGFTLRGPAGSELAISTGCDMSTTDTNYLGFSTKRYTVSNDYGEQYGVYLSRGIPAIAHYREIFTSTPLGPIPDKLVCEQKGTWEGQFENGTTYKKSIGDKEIVVQFTCNPKGGTRELRFLHVDGDIKLEASIIDLDSLLAHDHLISYIRYFYQTIRRANDPNYKRDPKKFVYSIKNPELYGDDSKRAIALLEELFVQASWNTTTTSSTPSQLNTTDWKTYESESLGIKFLAPPNVEVSGPFLSQLPDAFDGFDEKHKWQFAEVYQIKEPASGDAMSISVSSTSLGYEFFNSEENRVNLISEEWLFRKDSLQYLKTYRGTENSDMLMALFFAKGKNKLDNYPYNNDSRGKTVRLAGPKTKLFEDILSTFSVR